MGQSCFLVGMLADAGVPMIFLTFPAMLKLLVPIVLIEAWLYRRWVPLPTKAALTSSALANLASTLVGVPLAWGVMLLFQLGILGSILSVSRLDRGLDRLNGPLADVVLTLLAPAWLGPSAKYWMVPLATIVLLVPTYFLSVWIEQLIVRRMVKTSGVNCPDFSPAQLGVVVRNANLVSYGVLVFGSSVWLLVALVKYPH